MRIHLHFVLSGLSCVVEVGLPLCVSLGHALEAHDLLGHVVHHKFIETWRVHHVLLPVADDGIRVSEMKRIP